MAAHRALVALALAVVAFAAGCGGGDTTAGPAVVIEPGITAMQQAETLACDTERNVVQQALDAYTMLEGQPPADETALVPDYLRETSTLFDVTPAGAVVPAPGTPC